MKKSKVALVLFGQPRHVQTGQVFQNHQNLILEKYETDVYCHAWNNPSEEFYQSSWAENNGAKLYIPRSAVAKIHAFYQPEAALFERFDLNGIHNKNYTLILRLREHEYKNDPFFSPRNVGNIVGQMTSIQQAVKLVRHYFSYDWIVLARYDAVIRGFPDLNELDKSKLHLPLNGHFNDLIQIYSPSHFPELYDQITTTMAFGKPELFIPELIKYEHFKDNGYTDDNLNKIHELYADVIRTSQ